MDVWSLGVSLFESAFGRLPFTGDTVYEIAAGIRSNPLAIPDSASAGLGNLLQKMLCVNPNERVSMTEVAAHEFFAIGEDTDLSMKSRPDMSSIEVGSWPTRPVRRFGCEAVSC
jgi:serine/threonine protein kinase